MALATRCPQCGTTFKVAHDQLKLRAGMVRCGSCKQVFNGIEHLVRNQADEVLVPAKPTPPLASATPVVPVAPVVSNAASPQAKVNAPEVVRPPAKQESRAWPQLHKPEELSAPPSELVRPESPPVDAPPAVVANTEPVAPVPAQTGAAQVKSAPAAVPEVSAESANAVPAKPAPEAVAATTTPVVHAPPPVVVRPVRQPVAPPPVKLPPTVATPAPAPAPVAAPASVAVAEVTATPAVKLPEPAPSSSSLPALPEAAHEDSAAHIEPVLDSASDSGTNWHEPVFTEFELPPRIEPQLDADSASLEHIVEQQAALEQAAVKGEAESDAEEPEFVKQGRRSRGLRRVLGIVMGLGSVLLLFTGVGQAAYVFRNQLAASVPASKPWLEKACVPLHCQIGFPSQIKAVSLESDELQTLPKNKNMYALSTLLRNHSATVQSWPYIELSLNDGNDKTQARRVFVPREYLSNPQDEARGFAANAEQPVKLYFELNQLKVSGYRVYLFYP